MQRHEEYVTLLNVLELQYHTVLEGDRKTDQAQRVCMSGNTMYFQCEYLIGLGWSALLVTCCSVQRLRTIKSKNTQEVLLKTLQMHS